MSKPGTLLTMALPADFRHADVLRFYARDREQVSERTADQRIEKALHWQGQPALLQIDFSEPDHVLVELSATAPDPRVLLHYLRNLLGLNQDIDGLRVTHGKHPEIARMLALTPGLRMPQSASPFEAACWAVIGQMISVEAAISVRRRLIRTLGTPLDNGMICHPQPAQLLNAPHDALRSCGLSASKAATLLRLAAAVESNELPLDTWASSSPAPAASIAEGLAQIKGIGPWTQGYILLRGYGVLDGSMHGDVVVRKRLGALLNLPEAPDQKVTEQWLAQFGDWKALVAAHLWAMPADAPAKDY
ncbi:MAG: AlkA N-terminal domain-containing protein [Pseudomonadaceae bacterium]